MALRLAKKLRSGEIDLIAYVSSLCDKIESVDPYIHAVVPESYDRQKIINNARELLKRYPDPSTRPELFGIPIGVKDVIYTKDLPSRCGSYIPSNAFPRIDSGAVKALKGAGAIILCKTVTTEFAWRQTGATRNPHNTEYTPGGSSSGSAAGLAAGYFPFALGTQTGGSTLRPASFCGIVGFKPSFDRISTEGIAYVAKSIDTVGIFSEKINDLKLIVPTILSGWNHRVPEINIQKVVFGIPEGSFYDQASAHCRAHFEEHVDRLLASGKVVVKRIKNLIPDLEQVSEDYHNQVAAELARSQRSLSQYHSIKQLETKMTIEIGENISDEQLENLQEKQKSFTEHLRRTFAENGVDYLLCPASVDHALKGISSSGSHVMNYPITWAGLPTLSLPMDFDDENLPIGFQVVGQFMGDELLLQIAEQIEDILQSKKLCVDLPNKSKCKL